MKFISLISREGRTERYSRVEAGEEDRRGEETRTGVRRGGKGVRRSREGRSTKGRGGEEWRGEGRRRKGRRKGEEGEESKMYQVVVTG